VTRRGKLLCSYIRQSELAANDCFTALAGSNDGHEWVDQGPLWPELLARHSFCCNLNRDADGDLYLFGCRTRIDVPGETTWDANRHAIKQNDLVWARSTDQDGRSWTQPRPFPLGLAGAAETPAPMCVSVSHNTWVAPYAPYNTFDPAVIVDRGHLAGMLSEDRGRTWNHRTIIRFDEPDSGAAEAWVVELADGRLLATTWHVDLRPVSEKARYPNKYAISSDGGRSWSPARSTGICGQTTALAPLPDGRVLFVYVDRTARAPTIAAALVNPTADDFGVAWQKILWDGVGARDGTNAGGGAAASGADLGNWTAYRFGEPSLTLLPDGSFMLFYWYMDDVSSGIRYARLRLPI
jgi:hypothetical protein